MKGEVCTVNNKVVRWTTSSQHAIRRTTVYTMTWSYDVLIFHGAGDSEVINKALDVTVGGTYGNQYFTINSTIEPTRADTYFINI